MISLEKNITQAQFYKHTREVYAVNCSTGTRTHYLTKDSAYNKMENIKRQLVECLCLEYEQLHDLDVRPTYLRTEGGTVYELLSLSIDY